MVKGASSPAALPVARGSGELHNSVGTVEGRGDSDQDIPAVEGNDPVSELADNANDHDEEEAEGQEDPASVVEELPSDFLSQPAEAHLAQA